MSNAGPNGINSDYIGVDTVAYSCTGGIPTPAPTPTPTGTPTATPIATPGVNKITLPTTNFTTSIPTTANLVIGVTTTQIDPFPNPGPNPSPNPNDPGYIAFEGDFTFDSAVITFQSPFVQPAGLTNNNWNVSGNIINTGPGTIKTLRVSAFSLDFHPAERIGYFYII